MIGIDSKNQNKKLYKYNIVNNYMKEVSKLWNKIFNVAGSVASILIIVIILDSFNLVNDVILDALYLSLSLPLVITFVFSIFVNKPNARIRARKYGTLIYIILLSGSFLFFNQPESLTHFGKLILQFIAGFLVAFMVGIFYLIPYTSLKGKSFRIRAIISFSVSLIASSIALILLNKIKFISELIS